jgi:hypothetical protein
MFGTDEHSIAMRDQWKRSKQLRDPKAVKNMATDKGLQLTQSITLDAPGYVVHRNGGPLARGSLEQVAEFIEKYTIVNVR